MKTLVVAALALLTAVSLRGQHTLYVQQDGKLQPVRAVKGSQAMIDNGGQLVIAAGHDFLLKPAEEFFPVFIAVNNPQVGTTIDQIVGSSHAVNSRFTLEAEFASPFQLEDVFIVLVLKLDRQETVLFLHEIGRLNAYQPSYFKRSWPIGRVIREGDYEIHLFAGGREVFHSKQTPAFREAMLDRMVAKRTREVRDAAAKPFFGPVPEYPRALAKSKAAGEATVGFQIAPNGAVSDIKVLRCSDPAFGEAAATALRQWRFLPQIRNGTPVASSAEMPFGFTPPGVESSKP